MLVTGAAGFLGARVVRQLLDKGHAVRAVVRPASTPYPQAWGDRAEIVHADLQTSPGLNGLFYGVDVLIHLAAAMRGTAEAQLESATVITERLLGAMRTAGSTQHLVLAGSCSVYDWAAADGALTEESPLETNTYEIDGYAAAKLSQERMTRRLADENRWTLTVLRPGFIYGPGAGTAAGAGLGLGRLFLVIAPLSRLRLTHVENCAAAFVAAAEKRIAGTFNIIDDEQVSAWRYAGGLNDRGSGRIRIPVPYQAGLAMAHLAAMAGHLLPPVGRKLPAVLNPREYRARFKPLRYDSRQAREVLGWKCRPFFETGHGVT